MSTDPFEDEPSETITPPDDLRKKVRVMSKKEAAKFDPIAAAEAALERLSQNFDNWMNSENETLQEAWSASAKLELTKTNLDAVYQATHNIKGQAETLGYPLVGRVAANLCYLFEKLPDDEKLPRMLVDQHVSAVRAMIAEGANDEQNELGVNLVKRLEEVTDDYLAQHQGEISKD
ncbi:MAG: Hpt domain-containing protein [Rhodobacteraceae bacterium]|nr:Hpt domain-containing protein [Paracoccaceae bacterium]